MVQANKNVKTHNQKGFVPFLWTFHVTLVYNWIDLSQEFDRPPIIAHLLAVACSGYLMGVVLSIVCLFHMNIFYFHARVLMR